MRNNICSTQGCALITPIILILLHFLPVQTARASICNVDSMVAYDSVNELYWYRDISTFAGMSYREIESTIETMRINTSYEWRLASYDEAFATMLEWDGHYVNSEVPDYFTENQKSDENNGHFNWIGLTAHDVAPDFSETTIWEVKVNVFGDQPAPDPFVDLQVDSSFNIYSGPKEAWYDQVSYSGAWVVSGKEPLPVPEPSTFLLFGISLTAVLGNRKRSKLFHGCRVF